MLPAEGASRAVRPIRSAATPRQTDDLVEIAPEVVEASMSSYLRDGWRREQVVLERVECGAGGIRGHLTVSDYVGEFHLSALQVTIWIQQLGIVYACRMLDATKAEIGNQFRLRELTLRFRRPIRDPKAIAIEMRPHHRRITRGLFLCAGSVDVGSGAIDGQMMAVAPVPGRRDR